MASGSPANAEEAELTPRSDSSSKDVPDDDIPRLLQHVHSLAQQRAGDPQVLRLVEQARQVRAWRTYMADLADPVRRLTAKPPNEAAASKP